MRTAENGRCVGSLALSAGAFKSRKRRCCVAARGGGAMLPEQPARRQLAQGVTMRTMRVCSPLLCSACAGRDRAEAQPYPNKTIKVIVPFTPGSPVDAAGPRDHAAPSGAARAEHRHREPARRRHHDRDQGGRDRSRRTATRCCSSGRSSPTTRCSFRTSTSTRSRASRRSRPWSTWSHVHGGGAGGAGQNRRGAGRPRARPIPASWCSVTVLAPRRTSSARPSSSAAGLDIVSVPYRGGEQARADLLGGRDPHQFRAGAAAAAADPATARCAPLAYHRAASAARTCPTCRP